MTSEDNSETRAGHVALLGAPNAGKSTLLNALIGEKLSIVTSKAQTTRKNVTGIRTAGGAQAIFMDTPGLLDPSNLLQRSMRSAASQAIDDADVLVIIVDSSEGGTGAHQKRLLEVLPKGGTSKILVINKIDVATPTVVEAWTAWAEREFGARALPVSALEGNGVEELWAAIAGELPASPYLYDPDDLSTENMRFFVAELVRETALEALRQEIPYGLACAVEEYRENQDPVYIQTTIFVERNSQKGIVVGKNGAQIRELGKKSREKIEALVGRRIYLDLWVKVLPGWRTKKAALKRLGYAVPDDDDRG